MEKRNLTEYLSPETVEQLTGEAFQQPAAPKKKKAGPALALAASLAIIAMAVNPAPVYAAVRGLLYFLPGSGGTTQLPPADYWLPEEEYSYEGDGVSYFVTYLYRRGDTLALGVEKKAENALPPKDQLHFEEQHALPEDAASLSTPEDGPEEALLPWLAGEPPSPAPPEQQANKITVAIREEGGAVLDLWPDGHNVMTAYDTETGRGIFTEELVFEDFTLERFTLILDGQVEFPVTLKQVDPEDYRLDPAATVRDSGYAMTLLPLNSNCTRFALIPEPEDREGVPRGTYWTPFVFSIQAVGEDGTVYPAESSGSRAGGQEYYIPGIPEGRIRQVTVTGILESTRYEKAPAALKLPALEPGEEQAMEQELRLWNLTVEAEAAGLDTDGRMWVRLRLPAGDGVRYNQLDLDWPAEKGGGGSILEAGENGERLLTLYHNGMGHRAGKSTKLTVSFSSVVREGRWEFAQ